MMSVLQTRAIAVVLNIFVIALEEVIIGSISSEDKIFIFPCV
jgi:hypothetical protein